jgi:hypothetical protein
MHTLFALLQLLVLLGSATVVASGTAGLSRESGIVVSRLLCIVPASDGLDDAGPQALLSVSNERLHPVDLRLRVVAVGVPVVQLLLPRMPPLSMQRLTVFTPRDDTRLASAMVFLEDPNRADNEGQPLLLAQLAVVCGGAWDAVGGGSDGRARAPAHQISVLQPCGAFRGGCLVLGLIVISGIGGALGLIVAVVLWVPSIPIA